MLPHTHQDWLPSALANSTVDIAHAQADGKRFTVLSDQSSEEVWISTISPNQPAPPLIFENPVVCVIEYPFLETKLSFEATKCHFFMGCWDVHALNFRFVGCIGCRAVWVVVPGKHQTWHRVWCGNKPDDFKAARRKQTPNHCSLTWGVGGLKFSEWVGEIWEAMLCSTKWHTTLFVISFAVLFLAYILGLWAAVVALWAVMITIFLYVIVDANYPMRDGMDSLIKSNPGNVNILFQVFTPIPNRGIVHTWANLAEIVTVNVQKNAHSVPVCAFVQVFTLIPNCGIVHTWANLAEIVTVNVQKYAYSVPVCAFVPWQYCSH